MSGIYENWHYDTKNGKFMRLIKELIRLSFKRTFLMLQDTFKM